MLMSVFVSRKVCYAIDFVSVPFVSLNAAAIYFAVVTVVFLINIVVAVIIFVITLLFYHMLK